MKAYREIEIHEYPEKKKKAIRSNFVKLKYKDGWVYLVDSDGDEHRISVEGINFTGVGTGIRIITTDETILRTDDTVVSLGAEITLPQIDEDLHGKIYEIKAGDGANAIVCNAADSMIDSPSGGSITINELESLTLQAIWYEPVPGFFFGIWFII